MRRVLISLSGGIFFPLVLLGFTSFIGEKLDRRGMEWVVDILFSSFTVPLKIWERAFPAPVACPSCGPTAAALIATIVTVFIAYSLLTYLIQVIVVRFPRRNNRPLSETRA